MTGKSPERIPIADLKKKLDSSKKPIVVDVREPKEVADGMIPGALHIPMGQVEKRMSDFPKNSEIVFY